MFARFVCVLLSFCACKFLTQPKTQETRKIIVERTMYVMYIRYKNLRYFILCQRQRIPGQMIAYSI